MSDPLITLDKWPFDIVPFKAPYRKLVTNPIVKVSQIELSSASEQSRDVTLLIENGSPAKRLLEYALRRPEITKIEIDFDIWMNEDDCRSLILNLFSEPRPWTVTLNRGYAFRMDSLINRFLNFELDEEVNDFLVDQRWTNSISQLQLLGPMKRYERLSGALTPFLSHRLKGLYLYRFYIDVWSYDQDYEIDPDAFVSTIQTLSLSSCTICEYAFNPLLQILQGAVHLRSLSLISCSLDDEKLGRIMEALQNRPPEIGIHHLDLTNNNFCLKEETVHTIASFLSDPSCTLRTLNLERFFFQPPMGGSAREDFLESLWEALSTNNSIRQLGLASLYLQDWDIDKLHQALIANKRLSILRMDNNPGISVQGWSKLRNRLKGMTSNSTLDAIFYQVHKSEESTMNEQFPEKKAMLNTIRCISLTNVLLRRLCRSCAEGPDGGWQDSSNNDGALPPLGLYPHILERVSVAKRNEEEKAPPILYGVLFHVLQQLPGR